MAEKSFWGTSLILLAVSVEGQTEEEFTKTVLAPHLQSHGIHPQPVLLGRARGTTVTGGNVGVERLAIDMAHLSHSFSIVTSLVDFYGFQDKSDNAAEDLERLVSEEVRRKNGSSSSRILPYVQKHEFEALLFSDVNAFSGHPNASPEIVHSLRDVRAHFDTPEHINDNWATAPSRRITKILPRYRKRSDGPIIAENIGLPTIRSACPRFNQWITSLEELASEF